MAMAGESTGNNTAYSDGEFGGKTRRKVGLVYDETMCKHHTPTGEGHAECPDRIRVIWKTLQRAGVTQRCVVLGSRRGEDKHLQLVHSKDHVDLVKNLSTKQKDNRRNKIASKLNSIYLNGGSSEAAYLAAGSVVEVTKKVAEGELDCGFAIVRPPGHHAEENKPIGFCLFNNVAVAASYLLNERPDLGIKKILIVDWDVHHGNGTQKMFWKDPRVLLFSVHRHEHGNFYPAGDDGYYDMVGEGPGKGFNINVPWEQGGCGDADYFAAWDHILLPVAKEFKPDIVLLSAGFDAAINDPLGGCLVTPYGYSVMLMKLMEFAQGKIVMALEGGYNLDSIAKSSLACVQVLLEQKPIEGSCEAYPVESTWHVIQAVRKRLCAYWPSLANELSSKLINQKSPTPVIIPSSVSDSVTEDYAHGCLDRVSKFNIERSARSGARCSSGPRVASSEDPVVDSGSGGELPRPSSAVRDASKLKKRPADEVIDDATENTKRSRVRGAGGCEQCPAYSINNGLLPSVSNKLACANFIRSINGSGPEIPKVSDLAVSDLYQEFASSMVQAVTIQNRLTEAYERRVLDLRKRLKETHLSLEDERDKVQVAVMRAIDAEEKTKSSEAELLRANTLLEKSKSRIESLEAERAQTMALLEKTESLEAKLKSESQRSQKLSEAKGRSEFQRGADEMMKKCQARFDRVRQFLSARQVKGIQFQEKLDFVSVLESRGVSVPTDIVDTLTADLAKWQAEVQASSVEDPDEACLHASPLREGSSSIPIDLERC